MSRTKIEWTERVYNPVTGCSPISPGCKNCYAKRMAHRLAGRFGYPAKNPFKVTFHPDRLDEPLRWRKPSMVFIASMGDLFHPEVTLDQTADIFDVIRRCPQHMWQVLTKRPDRMRGICSCLPGGPLPNLWLGVTAEDQERADERIPLLDSTPAVLHFVSVEPMLSPVDVLRSCLQPPDWVIMGAETGPGARACDPAWMLDLIDNCRRAGIPVFVKRAPEGVPITREWPATVASLRKGVPA